MFEDLAQKYTFRFIGDSTTRRLAESFMSIVSGEGSPHPKAQERIDFSTKGLQVIFDWAPFCSGPLSVGEMLQTVMDEEKVCVLRKRTVIITAFGIHDASYQLQVSQMNIKEWYRDQMPQDVLKQDGFYSAALAACRAATTQVVDAAVGGRKMMRSLQDLNRKTRRLEAAALVTPLFSVETANSSNIDGDAATDEVLAREEGPPPLVFLLQNNGYFNDPDDFQQGFLDEVHRMQRQEVRLGKSEVADETGEGVFLVDSSVSLFKRLACYRIDPSSHYHEPTKLVEGKMLWNLFALVDREDRCLS
ncbi:unnamed protein product [Hapterophycus canaliculatus]